MTVHVFPEDVETHPVYAFDHYRRNGSEQIRYRSEADALYVARRKGLTGTNAYRCPTCNGFHNRRSNNNQKGK
jgi:hypothetical protein